MSSTSTITCPTMSTGQTKSAAVESAEPSAEPSAKPPAKPSAKQDAGGRTAEKDAAAWAHMVSEMKRAATHVDWSQIDLSKLAPKDIGVHVGPMMTEEQFRAYRARAGSAGVRVVKAPPPPPSAKPPAAK